MTVAAVLLNWKREHNLPVIVSHLRAQSAISHVYIWNNAGPQSELHVPEATTFVSNRNLYVLGRYRAMARIQAEWVFTCDDDYLVDNVGEIVALAQQNPDKIVAGLTPGHFKAEAGKTPWLQLGWGSCFRRDAITVLDDWVHVYGEDSLLERKADRIFTVLHGLHLAIPAKVTRLKDPTGRWSDESKDALYRRSDHYRLTEEAVRKAVELRDAFRRPALTAGAVA